MPLPAIRERKETLANLCVTRLGGKIVTKLETIKVYK